MTAVDFSAFVDELATLSGETILPFFRTALSVENKSRGTAFDPVTAADRAAETAMRSLIRRSFPA
ncbi:MAG: histidinol-phosphatase, partial [Hyphomicrobiales bacterium]|nr:histidinol-phosphatase [Hyphomicrobiales bacterium]